MFTARMTGKRKNSEGRTVDVATISHPSGTDITDIEISRAVKAPSPTEAIEAAGFSPVQWDFEIGNPSAIPVEHLFYNGHNAPIHQVDDLDVFRPSAQLGAARYQYDYGDGLVLDTLLVNKPSDVLVVYLHGATSRARTRLPRFERLATFSQADFASMYFSDPSLQLNDTIELTWFTGWEGQDVHQQIATMIRATAEELGYSTVIVAGASGGGFACLQVSALLPGSIAVPINPQTDIENYLIEGEEGRIGAQISYSLYVHPELETGWALQPGWSEPLGETASPLRRYSNPLSNRVLFVQNVNDFHYEQHYLPWLGAAARGGNLGGRFRIIEYDGGHGHIAPSTEVTVRAVTSAIEWAKSEPLVGAE